MILSILLTEATPYEWARLDTSSCICGMSHTYTWHASFVYVTWLIHMCDTTRYELMLICDMTRLYMWHDSYICRTTLGRAGLQSHESSYYRWSIPPASSLFFVCRFFFWFAYHISFHLFMRGGGLGSSTIFKNLMSPTPRRKWYLTTGRRAH